MRTDDLDAVKSKLYEESEPFLSAHPNYDISTLPSLVAESIEVARVYGNSKKGVILPDGRKYHLDNNRVLWYNKEAEPHTVAAT